MANDKVKELAHAIVGGDNPFHAIKRTPEEVERIIREHLRGLLNATDCLLAVHDSEHATSIELNREAHKLRDELAGWKGE